MMSKIDLRPFKFKPYTKDTILIGKYIITIKLDGVMAINKDGDIVSRNNKPLYNVNYINFTVAEIFLGDFDSSISSVHTRESKKINKKSVYSLFPDVDKRLVLAEIENPDHNTITRYYEAAKTLGYEGIVVRDIENKSFFKIKPIQTFDVIVTGITMGSGRNKDRVGALITDMGLVGIGLTDKNRVEFLTDIIGKMIEVECMELTKDNKFRHPRFIRVRLDKS